MMYFVVRSIRDEILDYSLDRRKQGVIEDDRTTNAAQSVGEIEVHQNIFEPMATVDENEASRFWSALTPNPSQTDSGVLPESLELPPKMLLQVGLYNGAAAASQAVGIEDQMLEWIPCIHARGEHHSRR